MAYRIRQTSFVLAASFAFLLGIVLAKVIMFAGVLVLICGFMLLITIRRKSFWTLCWVVLFGLCLGGWRGGLYVQHLADFQQHYGEKQTYIVVSDEDATYDKYKHLTFDSSTITVADSNERLVGKIAVSGFGENAIFAGDRVEVTGKLYPSRGSHQARLSYGTLHVAQRGSGLIPELRRRFVAGMQSALPEPLASFGMGLLIGQRANLPEHVYDALLMVGLVHIIAVSGYNLTIILRATDGLLKRHSKRLSLLLSLTMIGLFLLFAGASASIVRAAIISLLSLFAVYYGRKARPMVLLMLAAAISGWLNPYYIWGDVSWYLSFLAFFGVLIVAPMVMMRLPDRLRRSLVAAVAIETLCAELMTVPYVLYIFGQMSFAGLIANLVVAVFVPLAMLLCLVAGLAGMLVPFVAGWLAWPARYVLTYMLDSAELLSRIPHVFVEGLHVAAIQLATLYIVLLAVTVVLWHKTKPVKNVILTDEETASEP